MPLRMVDGPSSAFDTPENGIVGGYDGNDPTILRAITAFTAIAWYNSIETFFVVLFVFKRYNGLYFWSLEVTAFATIVYALGAWGKLLEVVKPDLLAVAFQNVAWIFMVTGQSVVLYSRLHLVTHNRWILRFVLGMIIFDTIVLYVPTSTLNYGSTILQTRPWVHGYSVFEKIQMTWFSVQEITISSLYLYEISNIFRITQEKGTRKVLIELLLLNISLILLDIALLSVEFLNLYMIETTLKGMVYSIKLKLELAVLSKIVRMVKKRKNSSSMTGTAGQEVVLRKTDEPTEFGFNPTVSSEQQHRKSSTISPREVVNLDDSRATDSSWDDADGADDKMQRINSRGIPIHNNEDLERYKQRRASSKRRSTDGLYPGRLGGEEGEYIAGPPE